MLNRKIATSLLTAMISLGGIVTPLSYAQGDSGDYIQKLGSNTQINWTDNLIKVTGVGAPPDKGNLAQKRLSALRMARVDGYRQLLEAINGVHVTSETVVKDFVTESDVIKTQVQGLVKGAKQISEPRYLADGSVEIDLQISLFGSAGKQETTTKPEKTETSSNKVTERTLASIIIRESLESNSKTDDTKLKPTSVAETYTGLIVDCRGLGIEPAMSPAIFDADDGEVYIGNLPIDPDYVVNVGIVSYYTSIKDAKKSERSGDNPLVVKATKSRGGFKADVTISNEDAKKLLGANQTSKFLNDSKVVFLI